MAGRRPLALFALMVAGEAAFLLPFVVPRVFRPTLLDVFGIDNTELGLAFSAYGVVAMASYAFGGPLADRFEVRWMMATALVGTALGGVWMATVPSAAALVWLYGVWGATTILLFWAGLMRATRAWGGPTGQGRAFGLLDGGRGLLAAVLSTLAVAGFAWVLGDADDPDARRRALLGVVMGCSLFTAATALLVAAVVPSDRSSEDPPFRLRQVVPLLTNPAVWLQALIVVCAYVGYKATDDVSLLAVDVLGWSEVEAAGLGTLSFWLRPPSALVAGLVADRVGGWRTVAGCFAVLMVADLGVVFGALGPVVVLVLAGVVGTAVAVYALRGVYFALTREAGVPLALTGSAVGLVSVVGYTPDVFMGPLMGVLLDGAPGVEGHRHLFAVMAAFALVGAGASLLFGRSAPRTDHRAGSGQGKGPGAG